MIANALVKLSVQATRNVFCDRFNHQTFAGNNTNVCKMTPKIEKCSPHSMNICEL